MVETRTHHDGVPMELDFAMNFTASWDSSVTATVNARNCGPEAMRTAVRQRGNPNTATVSR